MATKREREREEEEQRETKVLWNLKKKKSGKHLHVFCGVMVSQTKITHYIHLSTKARCASSPPIIPVPLSCLSVSFVIASLNFDLCDSFTEI